MNLTRQSVVFKGGAPACAGRFAAVIASVAALLLSAGCDRAVRGESRPITVVYWTRSWWGDPGQYQDPDKERIPVPAWQRQQIDRFEARHPDIHIDMQIDPGGRDDKIKIAFAGGCPPDLFHGGPDTEYVTRAALGLLEPIDPYLDADVRADIYPASLEACDYAGKCYAWPLYNHALGITINRDIFRERGLEDRIPGPGANWTMAEYAELARLLTFDRDGDGKTDVYGVGIHCLDANHVFLTAYLLNFGARVFSPGKGFVLDSEEGVAGLEFVRTLIEEKIATPGAAGYTYQNIRQLFVDQRIAMHLSSAGNIIYAEDQVRKGALERFDWAFVPIPTLPGVRPSSFLTTGAVFVSRQRDPVKRDACMEFAKYVTGHETNRHFWRMASPRRSSPLPPDPNLAAMMQQVENATNFMLPPRPLPTRFNLNEVMTRLYQDVLAHPQKKTAREALQDTARVVNAALEEAERSRQ